MYGLCLANAILMCSIALISNLEIDLMAKQTIFAVCRFLLGLSANTYSISVVLGVMINFLQISKTSIFRVLIHLTFKRLKALIQNIVLLRQM
jgi:hypothetical protein